MKNIVVILLMLILTTGCNGGDKVTKLDERLQLLAVYKLNIMEPSGLALDRTRQYLWTVSDQRDLLYKMSLDGVIVDSLRCDGKDLEGVAQNPADHSLYAIDEREGEIIQIDTTGDEIGRYEVPPTNNIPSSIEGISINGTGDRIYVLNERDPRLLMVFDEQFSLLNRYELNFSEDCSGLAFDETTDCLWILSDASRTITRCDLRGEPLSRFQLDIKEAEGITLDPEQKFIYIVSDSREKLYVYLLTE